MGQDTRVGRNFGAFTTGRTANAMRAAGLDGLRRDGLGIAYEPVWAIGPGYARGMGLKTRATFEEALADAMRKYTGDTPNILALPRTFTTSSVHLCMEDPALNRSMSMAEGHPCMG